MAHHALIVGCDAYPYLAGADLAGAVGDALAVRDWLVGPGQVQADNVAFLASPTTAGTPVPPSVVVTDPARKRAFAREVRRLVDRTEVGPDDRLFVYFAGHGCRTDPQNPALADDALVFTDFSDDDPGADAVGLRDLTARLEQTRFGAVLMFLDTCRHFPFDRPFQLGGLGFDPPAGRGVPPRLFLLQATLPGQQARGDISAGTVRGRFTTALLDGLAGAGSAKEYDERAGRPYVVRWSTLAAYVETAVADQQPRPRADGDLDLADFEDGFFGEVDLTVSVRPYASNTATDLELAVSYRSPLSLRDPLLRLPGPAPARFRVPQRRHRVTAESGGFWGRSAVDAYADTSVEITLGAGSTPAPAEDSARGPGQGQVRIVTDDPAAAIVVTSPDGRSSKRGVGQVDGPLDDGQYTVTVTDALGLQHREPLDIRAGFITELTVELPNPPGGVDREGRLRWAGEATAFAFDASPDVGSDQFLCLVPQPFSVEDGSTDVVTVRPAADAWQWVAAPAGAPWLELHLGAHRVEIPAAPGLLATVELNPTGLLVMYFDQAHLDDPDALLLLDRAQRLMRAGRPDAADVVLASDRRRTPLVGLLLGSPDTPLRGLARAAVASENRPYLLPGSRWAVLVDRQPASASAPA